MSSPIGVFDSGIGGLTVFKALARRMPGEHVVYFGDIAHLPYGSKSAEAVTRCSLAVARWLARRGIKLLVVACNTASALALPAIARELDVPVLGVIEPGARAAAAATRAGRVGVIGTEATVASGVYADALRRLRPGVRVIAAACPLFVPLVEEGWFDGPVTAAVARRYLRGLRRERIDALILGCTHYPALKPVLQRVLGRAVQLIDSAEQTALEAEQLLAELKLRKPGGRGRREFFVSDSPARFVRVAKRLGVAVAQVSLRRVGA